MRVRNSDYFNDDCIRCSDRVGQTIIVNTCTYEEVRVPWSMWEWFTFGITIIALIIIIYELLFGGE